MMLGNLLRRSGHAETWRELLLAQGQAQFISSFYTIWMIEWLHFNYVSVPHIEQYLIFDMTKYDTWYDKIYAYSWWVDMRDWRKWGMLHCAKGSHSLSPTKQEVLWLLAELGH